MWWMLCGIVWSRCSFLGRQEATFEEAAFPFGESKPWPKLRHRLRSSTTPDRTSSSRMVSGGITQRVPRSQHVGEQGHLASPQEDDSPYHLRPPSDQRPARAKCRQSLGDPDQCLEQHRAVSTSGRGEKTTQCNRCKRCEHERHSQAEIQHKIYWRASPKLAGWRPCSAHAESAGAICRASWRQSTEQKSFEGWQEPRAGRE